MQKQRIKLDKVFKILKGISVFYRRRENLYICNLYLEQYTGVVPQKWSLEKVFCCKYVAYLQNNTHAEVFDKVFV